MLPQNGHPHRHQQQSSLASFMPSSNFDQPSSYFNLDPSTAAKQIAALNAASQARIANSRSVLPPASPSVGGTSSGPYLGGITSMKYPSGPTVGEFPISNNVALTSNFQIPNHLGQPPNLASSPSIDPSMSQANPSSRAQIPLKQKQRNFLAGLANVMNNRNTPLPPAITGISYPPNYDPTNSQWKTIEPSPTEIGSFRLAGKDVDLFKLWGVVFQAGGGSKLNNVNGWSMILPHFDLPEHLSQPQPNGLTSVAVILSQYYAAILQPFEEAYRRNIQEQQRKAQAARQSGSQVPSISSDSSNGPGRPTQSGSGSAPVNVSTHIQGGVSTNTTSYGGQFPQLPTTNHHSPSTLALPVNQGFLPPPLTDLAINAGLQISSHIGENNILDEGQGIKRKLDAEEGEIKRARQKTGLDSLEEPSSTLSNGNLPSHPPKIDIASSSQSPSSMPASRPRPQSSRRKIEYVPFAREVDTYGGRDLKNIEAELANIPQRRPLRDINDWGSIDIEALTMSIRSRLSPELSYALTTFTLLSTMRGQTQGSGFPIFQCLDLLDEVLDLLEEQAFNGKEDDDGWEDNCRLATHRELVNIVYEVGSDPFAGLAHRQGTGTPSLGPWQRPGNIVQAIMNILRNLSTIPDNQEFLARHERLVDVILRMCCVKHSKDNINLSASSPILSLGDLVNVRKDTLYILINVSGLVHFSCRKNMPRIANRVFQLVSSYLVDPVDAVSPWCYMQLAGITSNGNIKPPSLPDIALDVFNRFSQSDANRQVLSQVIPQASLWRMFVALVHRLPVVDADFQLATRESWLSYLEKTIMAIYSLSFLAPPELKQKVKADRSLGFPKVMLRMVQKFLMNESRVWFIVCARRAIEAMKVVDSGEDSFDTSNSMVPTMSFGVGYGEVGENGTETGTGLLGGHRDVTWDMLMHREVDDIMFAELESLARVECCTPT